MSILIIEDLGVDRLAPIVLARLSSAVTCGAQPRHTQSPSIAFGRNGFAGIARRDRSAQR